MPAVIAARAGADGSAAAVGQAGAGIADGAVDHAEAASPGGARAKLWAVARRGLADPLTHFVIVGGAIFLAYSLRHPGPEKPHIAVTAAIQQSLAKEYELLHGLPPDARALAGLVDKYISDEVLFREALAQGMHLTDAKTRERLIEKLRFSMTDTVADPTDEQLVNFYADNLSLYYSEPKLSFDQVFYAKPPSDPGEVLSRLRAGEQLRGDTFWLGSHLEDYSQSMLRGVLGQRFIEELHAAPAGEWSGPLVSARGTHFVRVKTITASAVMPYVQVKDQVEQDWLARNRDSSVTAKIHKAEEKYDITIER
jgi:hypothetical protein